MCKLRLLVSKRTPSNPDLPQSLPVRDGVNTSKRPVFRGFFMLKDSCRWVIFQTVNVPALVSLLFKASFSSSFSPARDDAGTSEKLEQNGAFAFLGYCPARQKKCSPLGRLTMKQVRSLTSRRADFAGVLHEYGKTLMASRLNGSVPVEIEPAAYGSSSILVAVFQGMAVGSINPLACPMETA